MTEHAAGGRSASAPGPLPRRRLATEASAIAVIAHRDFVKLLRDRARLYSGLMFPLVLVLLLGPALQSGFGQAGGFDLTAFVFTRRWQIDRGKSLLGRTIQVWTSDNKVVYYRINRVRVTTNGMAGATSLRYERIWLQTSTGPNTTYPKLIVEGYRYAVYRTTYAAAHPTPRPVTC